MQIVSWYDELLRLTGSPIAALNRAVAVGEADGPAAGLAALSTVDPDLPRHTAASAYLHEKAGDLPTAARLYADAARAPPTSPNATTSPGRRRGSVNCCPGWVRSPRTTRERPIGDHRSHEHEHGGGDEPDGDGEATSRFGRAAVRATRW